MSVMSDTWVMAKRSLKHTIRSVDTIITVAAMPIALMLMFVFVLGYSQNTGTSYINFVTPGIVIMTVLSGIAYAALRINNDLSGGIINRFKTMPVASSSILGGHAVSSVVSNLFSVAIVIGVAFLAGFRPEAGIAEWGLFAGILTLFTTAVTWLAIYFGLLAKTAEGAGSFSYILLLMLFVSSAFTPSDQMHPALRGFAENQPMTPIIETLRSLMVNGTAGDTAWIALAWSAGLLVVAYFLAIRVYKKKTF